jgi:hypothetical protein
VGSIPATPIRDKTQAGRKGWSYKPVLGWFDSTISHMNPKILLLLGLYKKKYFYKRYLSNENKIIFAPYFEFGSYFTLDEILDVLKT